jgi:hypothetical protein
MATVTTKDNVKKMLTDNGMFDTDAEKILAIAIPKIERLTPQYQITWDRPASEYPDVIYPILWMTIKDTAKEWIEKNQPLAWYRPLFD